VSGDRRVSSSDENQENRQIAAIAEKLFTKCVRTSPGVRTMRAMSETFTATPPGLLQRIARGDKAAMRELLSQYGPLVWSLAKSFTRSSADAEDAAQDVFVHLWKKAAQYDPAHGLEVQFVSVLARRRLIDWIRAHTNSPDLAGYSPRQSTAAANAQTSLDEEAALAWNVLANLSPDHQAAVTLSVLLMSQATARAEPPAAVISLTTCVA
jgi:RNA polymerase sigma-70 factor (ECF subfamily)